MEDGDTVPERVRETEIRREASSVSVVVWLSVREPVALWVCVAVAVAVAMGLRVGVGVRVWDGGLQDPDRVSGCVAVPVRVVAVQDRDALAVTVPVLRKAVPVGVMVSAGVRLRLAEGDCVRVRDGVGEVTEGLALPVQESDRGVPVAARVVEALAVRLALGVCVRSAVQVRVGDTGLRLVLGDVLRLRVTECVGDRGLAERVAREGRVAVGLAVRGEGVTEGLHVRVRLCEPLLVGVGVGAEALGLRDAEDVRVRPGEGVAVRVGVAERVLRVRVAEAVVVLVRLWDTLRLAVCVLEGDREGAVQLSDREGVEWVRLRVCERVRLSVPESDPDGDVVRVQLTLADPVDVAVGVGDQRLRVTVVRLTLRVGEGVAVRVQERETLVEALMDGVHEDDAGGVSVGVGVWDVEARDQDGDGGVGVEVREGVIDGVQVVEGVREGGDGTHVVVGVVLREPVVLGEPVRLPLGLPVPDGESESEKDGEPLRGDDVAVRSAVAVHVLAETEAEGGETVPLRVAVHVRVSDCDVPVSEAVRLAVGLLDSVHDGLVERLPVREPLPGLTDQDRVVPDRLALREVVGVRTRLPVTVSDGGAVAVGDAVALRLRLGLRVEHVGLRVSVRAVRVRDVDVEQEGVVVATGLAVTLGVEVTLGRQRVGVVQVSEALLLRVGLWEVEALELGLEQDAEVEAERNALAVRLAVGVAVGGLWVPDGLRVRVTKAVGEPVSLRLRVRPVCVGVLTVGVAEGLLEVAPEPVGEGEGPDALGLAVGVVVRERLPLGVAKREADGVPEGNGERLGEPEKDRVPLRDRRREPDRLRMGVREPVAERLRVPVREGEGVLRVGVGGDEVGLYEPERSDEPLSDAVPLPETVRSRDGADGVAVPEGVTDLVREEDCRPVPRHVRVQVRVAVGLRVATGLADRDGRGDTEGVPLGGLAVWVVQERVRVSEALRLAVSVRVGPAEGVRLGVGLAGLPLPVVLRVVVGAVGLRLRGTVSEGVWLRVAERLAHVWVGTEVGDREHVGLYVSVRDDRVLEAEEGDRD